jgi:Zn2+/Cd2+-exporting ATPase
MFMQTYDGATSRLPFAVGLGRATRAIIVQNQVIALGMIAALSVASLLGLASIGVAVLMMRPKE